MHAVLHLPTAWLQLYSACRALGREQDANVALSASAKFCSFDVALADVRATKHSVDSAMDRAADAVKEGSFDDALKHCQSVLNRKVQRDDDVRNRALYIQSEAFLKIAVGTTSKADRADFIQCAKGDAEAVVSQSSTHKPGWINVIQDEFDSADVRSVIEEEPLQRATEFRHATASRGNSDSARNNTQDDSTTNRDEDSHTHDNSATDGRPLKLYELLQVPAARAAVCLRSTD